MRGAPSINCLSALSPRVKVDRAKEGDMEGGGERVGSRVKERW